MGLPQTAKELFDVEIPKVLEKDPSRAKEVGAIYCFKIAGDDGGEWTVDLTAEPPTCKHGDSGNAQCTVEVDHSDFKQMLTDPQSGMQLYFEGKLKVTGDPMLATKLQQLFKMAS